MKKKIAGILLVTATALLTLSAGCRETPFSPPSIEKPPMISGNGGPNFGLVEVTISGIGTQSMTATAFPARRNTAADISPVFGTDNAALALDGVDDWVQADGVAAAIGADAFTIEAWVKPEPGSGGNQTLFGFHTSSGGNLNIVFYDSATKEFSYYDAGTGFVISAGSFPTGNWYHVAVTVSSTGNGILYVNGQPKATFTATVSPDATGHFSVGQEYDGSSPSNFFHGTVDELRAWSIERTQAEIQANMNQEINPATAGLVAYYQLNNTAGATAVDMAGSNDGTLQGGPVWDAGGTPQIGTPTGDGTIQLELISNGSFTHGARGNGGMRYLYATFKVRNAQLDGTSYNTPRQNLTFLAVDTDESFGENETYGITAISELRLFNGDEYTGSDAMKIATHTIPTGWAKWNPQEGIRTEMPDVLQVYTETDVEAVNADPGVEVFPYGFITRSPHTTMGSRTLPSAPSVNQFDGYVTFAFKMPLQTQANDDPFEISMMFLPVDDDKTRLTQSIEEQTPRGAANFLKRADGVGATTLTLLPRSSVFGIHGKRVICTVRTSGSADNPITTLFPMASTEPWLIPDPRLPGASFLPKTTRIGVARCPEISTAEVNGFIIQGQQSGPITGPYTGAGTSLLLAPVAPGGDFFPGEIVEVTLKSQLTGGTPVVAHYRIKTAESSGTFSSATAYDVGDLPAGIVSGDFDNNGNLDLAVINSLNSNMNILMGKGDGTFVDGSTYEVGDQPQEILTGDLNSDGILDLVIANSGSDDISILLGNGDGTFSDNTIVYTVIDGSLVDCTIDDLDGDGDLDIVITNEDLNNITVLLGNGDGTFTAGATVGVGTGPWSITTGDFDKDGDLDLAVANGYSDDVTILSNNGNGTFNGLFTYHVNNFPWDITAGDFNRDGNLDLATLHYTSSSASTVVILSGSGKGSFIKTSTIPTAVNTHKLTAGDLDGDGDLDIAVCGFSSDVIAVHLNHGNGTFKRTNYNAGLNINNIISADFDNDGALDIAVTNRSSQHVSVLLNQ